MRLTPRRRTVIAVLAVFPVGWLYVTIGWQLFIDLLEYWLGGNEVGCADGINSLPSRFNGCYSDFHAGYAVVELLIGTAIAIAVAIALGRWVAFPIRDVAETVERLGPTSLGMRLGTDGPQDETRRLSEAVNAMLDRVAEGYEAQRRFAANASHELRTPLATQRALIEISLASALTPEQLDLLSRQLLATNERNELLIEGLLVLAETERGLVTTGPQRLDLITAAVVETLRPFAKERGVEIDAITTPAEVLGEAPLIERLVTNLVQNAIKYNVEDGWVRVVVTAAAGLVVANSGVRVAPESVDGLFEPFRRASGDRLDHGGGVGLGLTIARSVVAAHNGTIRVSANAEGGLTVEVQLPKAL